MIDLKKSVVKKKKLQILGNNFVLIIPKKWIDTCKWNRNTELTLEFMPERNLIIICNTTKTKYFDIKNWLK